MSVLAEVSQHSRDVGRLPIHVQVERLNKEWDELDKAKKQIEAKLGDVNAEKREALARVYRSGVNKSTACARTNEIEAKFQADRSKLIREKSGIEDRLNAIKGRRKDLQAKIPREDVAVLLRIEQLLIRLVNQSST